MSLTIPSFAKINWTLEILGKRPDGYHELRTLLQTVDLADELTFEPRETGIEIICDHPDVPTDETNLVHGAARLFRDLTGVDRGISVKIDKRLPTAAGVGGGSSNAAVTLLALQRLWGVELQPRQLFTLAAKLGADVPFFLIGGTGLGIGRGDEVYPLDDFNEQFLLLVNAGIQIPTREVYANLPPELTKKEALAKMPFSFEAAYTHMAARIAAQGEQAQTNRFRADRLHNDLEIPVLPRHPLLVEIKRRLAASGARGVLMSGSGSTVFAIFDSEEARSGAKCDLSTTGWWCAPARTLSRHECQQAYRQALAEPSA